MGIIFVFAKYWEVKSKRHVLLNIKTSEAHTIHRLVRSEPHIEGSYAKLFSFKLLISEGELVHLKF